MPPRLSSPVTWIGGKGRLLKHILPLIRPCPGESLFVEPCGGSGVVMINKEPHPSETYNDTDGDLVNLFRVIRDPDGVVHLWWELINTPVSRAEFRDSLKVNEYSPESPVQRAAAFVIRCRQRFGGGHSGLRADSDRSWGTARSSARGVNDCVSRWLGTMLGLPIIHRRLSTVVIDQQDFERCIRQWDSPSTLFYIDPPYVGTEGYYRAAFKTDDHARLADLLSGLQGRAVLSYYACREVDALYPDARWQRLRIRSRQTASGHAPRDPNGPAGAMKASSQRTELILTNFDRRTRRKLA